MNGIVINMKVQRYPKCFKFLIPGHNEFNSSNHWNMILPDAAHFLLLNNRSKTDLLVQLNDDPEAVFTLDARSSISFNSGDIHIASLDFANPSEEEISIEVIAGIAK